MDAGTQVPVHTDCKERKVSMALSMYELTIPTLLRGFGVLSGYLEKAEDFARTKALDPVELISGSFGTRHVHLRRADPDGERQGKTRSGPPRCDRGAGHCRHRDDHCGARRTNREDDCVPSRN